MGGCTFFNSGSMKPNKTLQYIIQAIGWGIVFCFPLFFMSKDEEQVGLHYLGYVFVPVAFMVIFYANYVFLIDRLLFRKRMVYFLVANLALFLLLIMLLDWWREYYLIEILGDTPRRGDGPPKAMFLLRDGAIMALTAALSVAIKVTNNWYVSENERKELEKVRTEAELQNLKSQLNPHFLFNTLNNIYSLIAIDAERAQYAVHDLSRLLRHVLYENKQLFVPLEGEVAFMRSYIELMSLRLPGKVDLQVDLPEAGSQVMVAPLLFISLIENAFKHGVSPTEHSFIHISLQVIPSPKEAVVCRIENSNYPKHDNDRSGSGIGLPNLRKRLDLLYAGKYEFRTGVEGDRYVAYLKILC